MTQKELKSVYTEELKKAWTDEKMVAYCSKSTAFVIEHNGMLYGIKKPQIETHFCFGYGMYGITDSNEEKTADEMVEIAQKSEEYFINQNLESINRWIKSLQKIQMNMGRNWAEGR